MTQQSQSQKQVKGNNRNQSQRPRKPISLDALRTAAQGEIISISDHAGKGTMDVRVRRIDLSADVLNSGLIPTDLQQDVMKQFGEGKSGAQIEQTMEKQLGSQGIATDINKLLPAINQMCAKVLVEPTWDDFQEIYPLTLPQKMEIFQWVTDEIKEMSTFRKKSRNNHPANR